MSALKAMDMSGLNEDGRQLDDLLSIFGRREGDDVTPPPLEAPVKPTSKKAKSSAPLSKAKASAARMYIDESDNERGRVDDSDDDLGSCDMGDDDDDEEESSDVEVSTDLVGLPTADGGVEAPRKRKRKRAKISPEQKAELTRQRNREHARSTRRRKKMYVECLKKQVAELLAKQQQLQHGVFEPLSGRQAEEITLRKAVVQTFLEYRTTDVRDHAKWCDIVDDDFELLLPNEPYRACAVGELVGNTRHLRGVDVLAADTMSMSSLVNMIRVRARQLKPQCPARKKINLMYGVDSSDILVSGDKLMCHWRLCSSGLKEGGFASEVMIDGMLKATFSKGKLTEMELTFDACAFLRQLQESSLLDLTLLLADADDVSKAVGACDEDLKPVLAAALEAPLLTDDDAAPPKKKVAMAMNVAAAAAKRAAAELSKTEGARGKAESKLKDGKGKDDASSMPPLPFVLAAPKDEAASKGKESAKESKANAAQAAANMAAMSMGMPWAGGLVNPWAAAMAANPTMANSMMKAISAMPGMPNFAQVANMQQQMAANMASNMAANSLMPMMQMAANSQKDKDAKADKADKAEAPAAAEDAAGAAGSAKEPAEKPDKADKAAKADKPEKDAKKSKANPMMSMTPASLAAMQQMQAGSFPFGAFGMIPGVNMMPLMAGNMAMAMMNPALMAAANAANAGKSGASGGSKDAAKKSD